MYTGTEKDIRKEIWDEVSGRLDQLHKETMEIFERKMLEQGLSEDSEIVRESLESYYWLIRKCLRTQILEDTDEELFESIGGDTIN